jgi:hypothetical protein
MTICNYGEFLSLIEKVDTDLAVKGIPIPHRTLQALGEISTLVGLELPVVKLGRPPDPTCFEPQELSWHIYCWYTERYGNKLIFEICLGRISFLLRGDVWFVRIPLVYGSPKMEFVDFVEDLTDGLRRTLTRTELDEITRVFQSGYEAFMYLVMKDSDKFINECLSDHRIAIDQLKAPNPHPGQSKWASLQATEKVLKSFITSKGGGVRRIHFLLELTEAAEALGLNHADRIKRLLPNIQCDPGVRYGDGAFTLEDAVCANQSALEVSGLVAVQL